MGEFYEHSSSTTVPAIWGEGDSFEGVRGLSHTADHAAVVGVCDQNNGTAIFGTCDDSTHSVVTGKCVYGFSPKGAWGVLGESQDFEGVRGISHSEDHAGVVGVNDAGGFGNHTGVFGTAAEIGVFGRMGNTDPPFLLFGGVVGFSTQSSGVFKMSTAAGNGQAPAGVEGQNATGPGLRGSGQIGVFASGTATGLIALGPTAIVTNGDCQINGTLSATSKQFRIDHPLDPANKYLNHYSVESSQAKNVYDGSVLLDEKGEAVVELPTWFEALNSDFRYQLTPIGKCAPLYISRKLLNSCFMIAGGEAGMEVCWQITGVRNDAYARSHPTVVEQEKSAEERGYYLDPASNGAPKEQGISWLKYPDMIEQSQPAPTK